MATHPSLGLGKVQLQALSLAAQASARHRDQRHLHVHLPRSGLWPVPRLRLAQVYAAGQTVFSPILGPSPAGVVDVSRETSRLEPSYRSRLRRLTEALNSILDASQLMGYRDRNGQGWPEVIDFLTMYPDARRWYGCLGRSRPLSL